MKLGQVLERFRAGDQLRKFPHLLGGVLVGGGLGGVLMPCGVSPPPNTLPHMMLCFYAAMLL